MPSDIERGVLDRPAAEMLRPLVRWVIPLAEKSLAVFEACNPSDDRPRAAFLAAKRFAQGGPRGEELRTTASAALKAASESSDPIGKAAARAASFTASAAYMHLDVIKASQLKHAYGPVVYSAQALELEASGDERVGETLLLEGVETATPEVIRLVRGMPRLPEGTSRLARMYAFLDSGLVSRIA
ncbi:MAG TPA: hypothetical protein VED59_08815 [Acidimicrobiales bacterium]|nr:hypothetical protein [Acidimicrobiales bacterium]